VINCTLNYAVAGSIFAISASVSCIWCNRGKHVLYHSLGISILLFVHHIRKIDLFTFGPPSIKKASIWPPVKELWRPLVYTIIMYAIIFYLITLSFPSTLVTIVSSFVNPASISLDCTVPMSYHFIVNTIRV